MVADPSANPSSICGQQEAFEGTCIMTLEKSCEQCIFTGVKPMINCLVATSKSVDGRLQEGREGYDESPLAEAEPSIDHA